MKDSNSKLFIIAGNFVQALKWAEEHELTSCMWSYVSSVYSLKGMRNYEYVLVGTWYDHPAIDKIEEELRIAHSFGYVKNMLDK